MDAIRRARSARIIQTREVSARLLSKAMESPPRLSGQDSGQTRRLQFLIFAAIGVRPEERFSGGASKQGIAIAGRRNSHSNRRRAWTGERWGAHRLLYRSLV